MSNQLEFKCKLDELRDALRRDWSSGESPYGARLLAARISCEIFGYEWANKSPCTEEAMQCQRLIRTIFVDTLGERIKANPSVHWGRFQKYARKYYLDEILGVYELALS